MGKSEKKKKHKNKRKEHKEKHKDKVKSSRKHNKTKNIVNEDKPTEKLIKASPSGGGGEDFAIPIALMNSKSHAPETPEEYERRQSQIRREVDPVTGRIRLIKGDSEILEEIVSKDRHNEINRKATRGDGEYYESRSLATASAAKRQKPK